MRKHFTENMNKSREHIVSSMDEYPTIPWIILGVIHLIFNSIYIIVAWILEILFLRGSNR